ncbi:MAG: HAD family hydrolase [Bacteroidetes bacterium]|nr:HAD family hydrolase [Bacteroidota bacterium]
MKQKAVFLDRDGVLNREVGDYIKQLSDFELLPHAFEGLKILKEKGYLLIVITNQGGIAKGEYTREAMHEMHGFMRREFEKQGILLDAIYYCPHHPIQTNCLCRKPESILVEKAIAKFNINPEQSWFIGDKQRDIDSGNKAGVKGVLIEPNEDWIPHAQTF